MVKYIRRCLELFRKIILLSGISLLGLSGCATTTDFVTGKYIYGGAEEISIDFSDNNTFTLSEGEETKSGEWKQSGKELTLSLDEKKYCFEITHNKMLLFEADKSDKLQEVADSDKFSHVAYVEDGVIYIMTGNSFDFATLSDDIEKISLIKATNKDNIHDEYDKEVDDTYKKIIYRTGGRMTLFSIKGTKLQIVQSDGEDEAEIEITKTDGTKETYKVVYDCACG